MCLGILLVRIGFIRIVGMLVSILVRGLSSSSIARLSSTSSSRNKYIMQSISMYYIYIYMYYITYAYYS